MIREAKGVALHDLSFWASALPMLEGFHRVSKAFQVLIGGGVPLNLDMDSGGLLHDECLEVILGSNAGEGNQPVAGSWAARRMAVSTSTFLLNQGVTGEPRINVEVEGCGLVVGGRCDLVWDQFLVELKLTAKEPGVRDVRQVLVYASLMHLADQEVPPLGLVANPRLGLGLRFVIEELLMMTGGLSLLEFADRLGRFLVEFDNQVE